MGKAIEKQIKTIQDQGKKQIEALRNLKPKEETKSIEGIFLEGYESVENKNEIKLKNMKKNSIETMWFIIHTKNHLILKYLKQ